MDSELLHIGYEVPGGVVLGTEERRGVAAPPLVKENHAPLGQVKTLELTALKAAAWSAMQNNGYLP
jgi:hypothetical protein